MQRPKVTDIFTPRRAEVNDVMYIRRPAHERDLKRSIEGSLHSFVCGESGSGKSWLYKHVADAEQWKVFCANAGNAARYGSISQTIAASIFPEDSRELKEYTQTIEGKAEAFGFGGSANAERKYEIKKQELLLSAFRKAREIAKDKVALIVVDNLEAIFLKPERMEELGNIILLLDDEEYAKHKIKILIIGTPSEVIDYYQKTQNLETVANRLREVPALNSLTLQQITDFVRRGFYEQLKIELVGFEIKEIAEHVELVTLGIPQRMHEYCEFLGSCLEDAVWRFDKKHLTIADDKYLNASLRKAYSVIESSMNERRTKTGRRNQVLFSLGKVKTVNFDSKEVEAIVRTEFPVSTQSTVLAVGQTLAELAEGDAPLLRRNIKGNYFRFADPRYLMCLRLMLQKTQTGERVIKATFRR